VFHSVPLFRGRGSVYIPIVLSERELLPPFLVAEHSLFGPFRIT